MMDFKTVFQSGVLRSNRSMMGYVAVTGILVLVTLFGTSKAVLSYQQAQNVKQQTVEMQKTISDWKEKVNYLEDQTYRPVKPDEVESVTSDILYAVQGHNLKLDDYKIMARTQSKDKKATYQDFTMSISGTYQDTVSFLQMFRARNALVQIISLKLAPQNGAIKTTMQYRVYVVE